MKKIYDYLGNEIKEGMTIQIIETDPFFSSMQLCVLHNGKMTKIGEPIEFPKNTWIIKEEYLIVSNNDKLYYRKTGLGVVYDWDLSMLEFGLQSTDKIAIKGISDINSN